MPGCLPLPCAQFETALQALSQLLADQAVLPIENSAGGSIHAVYDLLLRRGPALPPYVAWGSLARQWRCSVRLLDGTEHNCHLCDVLYLHWIQRPSRTESWHAGAGRCRALAAF